MPAGRGRAGARLPTRRKFSAARVSLPPRGGRRPKAAWRSEFWIPDGDQGFRQEQDILRQDLGVRKEVGELRPVEHGGAFDDLHGVVERGRLLIKATGLAR